jgi:hypothetical protein
MSTFGYLAASLSGKKPVLLNIISRSDRDGKDYNYTTNEKPICEEAFSTEPCQLYSSKHLSCGGALTDNISDAASCFSFIKRCQDSDLGVVIN